VLQFWSLDRFSREGVRKILAHLQQFDVCRVRFRSYTEPYLNTDNELIAHIVLGVTAHYAQAAAVRIGGRTKAGLERARGKVLGRPEGFERWRGEIAAMRDGGDVPKAEMARRTGLSVNTVKRYLRRLEVEEAPASQGGSASDGGDGGCDAHQREQDGLTWPSTGCRSPATWSAWSRARAAPSPRLPAWWGWWRPTTQKPQAC